MPVPYDWSKTPKTYLDKNDKIGLLLGTILAGGMGAASGRGGGDSALRGVAGAAAGFGGGANQLEENYSRMIKEAMDRQQQEYQQNMLTDKFGFEKQKYEETGKPESVARINWYNQRDMPDYNKIRDERVKRRLDIKTSRKNLGKPSYSPGEESREAFENINNLKSLPPDQLALLRKDPEYITALNAFVKPNIMAEPYVPNLGEPAKTPQKGLWESIKGRFAGESKQDTVSKGVTEALSGKSDIQEMPDPSKHTGKTLRDTVTNKKYISDGKNWNPIQ